MIWLLLAVACGSGLLGYLTGARVPWVDDDESLIAAFFSDLAVEQQEHAEERERADALAEALRSLLFDTYWYAGVDQATAALRAHDGARAHR